MPSTVSPVRPISVAAHLSFVAGSMVLLMVLFSLLRAALLAYNSELAAAASAHDISRAFFNGLRFDLRITVFMIAPLLLALPFQRLINARRLWRLWLTFCAAVALFLGVMELNFYAEFHQRLNSLVFQYLKEDPATVVSMLWHGFPVVRLVLAWLVASALLYLLLRQLDRLSRGSGRASSLFSRALVLLLCVALATVAARGTLRQGSPLRWGDAFNTGTLFTNHLGLNAVQSLADAARNSASSHRENLWKSNVPADEALARVRQRLLLDTDQLVEAELAPVRRVTTPPADTRLPVRNVVVILMESFAGRYVGALGDSSSITPHFDALAEEGLLFTQFFSNGTHTHQGMFATMACFPNLPAFEYLMQTPEGGHPLSGLPALLAPRGYQDAYVYNGDFAWDNQRGFFGNQGMRHFVGRRDYINPVFSDPTWGVSDQDMFARAVEELDRMDPAQPFYALLQSLSNHTPYALPDPLPVAEVSGHGRNDLHLTAMRYSDWALGQFFAAAKTRDWYQDTLFVILGDHGFGAPEQLTDMDLYRHHVPLLLLAPGIQERFGATRDTVATQVDVVPTALGRLGERYQHQCWGRDLLALPADDPGYAIIKPSGTEQTVALIRNGRALIQPRGSAPQAWQFALGERRTAQRDQLSAQDREDLRTLDSYLQVATRALLDNNVGIHPAPGGR